MRKIRIVLVFPPSLVVQPITYQLVKNYDLMVNILRGKITHHEEGKLVLELGGSEANLQAGIDFLTKQGIEVSLLTKSISWNENECIHCGACTAVCPSHALALDPTTWYLGFDRDKCLVCELCVSACPLRVIEISF